VLHLGPLTFAQFEDFLPIGRGFRAVGELARFHAGQVLDFDIRLILLAAEVPATRLSATSGPRLGWTSWLKTRAFTEDDEQVRLHPRQS
jgi:type VI secretion system protein ImpH